ncbi:MAG: aquaporin [Gemmatimonadota bacterium]|nr:aquaporin [Gemmatimonadota bacterium]
MTARLVTELIGTFVLVATIGFVVLQESVFAPVAIGSALMIAVYMGGHISGAHYNPAVTLGVWMRGKLETRFVGPYMLAQLAGAVLGALFVWWLVGQTFVPAPGGAASMLTALAAELVFTFVLVLVVLNVATTDATAGNSHYGLAIGFTVLTGAFAVGAISGGAFNPAVGVGPAIVHVIGGGPIGHVWLYLVGPFLGGALAAYVYRLQHRTV